jgi:cytochrome c oxidase subunit 2
MLVSGCTGPQSALAPAGRGAEQLAGLFWVMAVGATAVWLIVMGLGVYSLLRPGTASPKTAAFYLIGGGTLFPTIVLAALLMVGLSLLPAQLKPAPAGSLRIDVVGYQWWWQVRYPRSGGEIRLANEIHLPVGEPVEFHLTSEDVIHSFWIPSLGGKVDMIPGRQTRLTLYPTRTGLFRGACAEFCGASHALMSFDVVVQEKAAFADWLTQQSQPAPEPESTVTSRGQHVFLNNGCGACHTVRGTSADGEIGPDLTHVGGRLSLAAGILENDPAGFLKWLEHPKSVKPGAHMPLFGMLPADDLRALAAYLDSLQ